MEFRRSGNRDERRRRVLIDEASHPSVAVQVAKADASSSGGGSSEAPVQPYTEAALSPRQRRVVDVIPTRRWTILLLLSVALSVVAGLESLYGYVALDYTTLRIDQVPAIDLATRGNIGTWFAAGLYLMSAVLGVLTYLIRRHRVDDYRGRYRMWYWMVPCFVIASLDQVADLQGSIRTVLLHVAGIPDYADATLVWMASLAVVVGAVGLRLAIEMRGCRMAVASLLLAAGCYAGVGGAALDWLLAEGGVFREMALTGLALLGHVALFTAMCLYARHVHREARGQVRPRVPKKRPKRQKSRGGSAAAGDDTVKSEGRTSANRRTHRASGTMVRQDAAHTLGAAQTEQSRPAAAGVSASQRPQKLATAARQSGSGGDSEDDASNLDDDAPSSRKLSKAERRRLRKQRRQER